MVLIEDRCTHLGAESEDGHVSTVGKNDVCQSSDDIHQVGVLGPRMPMDGLTAFDQDRRILYSGPDDGDKGSGQNAE